MKQIPWEEDSGFNLQIHLCLILVASFELQGSWVSFRNQVGSRVADPCLANLMVSYTLATLSVSFGYLFGLFGALCSVLVWGFEVLSPQVWTFQVWVGRNGFDYLNSVWGSKNLSNGSLVILAYLSGFCFLRVQRGLWRYWRERRYKLLLSGIRQCKAILWMRLNRFWSYAIWVCMIWLSG